MAWMTSSTPPWSTSTGSTIAASTVNWGWSHLSSSRRSTTISQPSGWQVPNKSCLYKTRGGSKCCYCERTLPKPELEVEHFRPRRGVRQLPDQPTHDYPGYYWLAYAWTNLLLACRTCNGNKSNRFPLRNPTKRARSHQDDLAKERPLFVDPTAMNPRRHISFEDEVPKGRTRVGKTTIDNIGLNGAFLGGKTRQRLRMIDAYRDVVLAAKEYPGDAELQGKAAEFRSCIKSAN